MSNVYNLFYFYFENFIENNIREKSHNDKNSNLHSVLTSLNIGCFMVHLQQVRGARCTYFRRASSQSNGLRVKLKSNFTPDV